MIVWPLIAMAAAGAADQPGWNCDDPIAQQEMNYCAHQDYLAADAHLNAQWQKTATIMKLRDENYESPVDDRAGYFATMLAAQRAWITYRDQHCTSEGYYARGGSLEPLLVATCKTHLTIARTEQLVSLAGED